MLFLDGKQWQSLTNKRTSDFLEAKTLQEKFDGLNIMKSVLSLDETPSALERHFKAATKLGLNYQQIQRWKVYPKRSFRL